MYAPTGVNSRLLSQRKHLEPPDSAMYSPESHWEHSASAVEETKPGEHCSHDAWSVLGIVPPGQSEHEDISGFVDALPDSQVVQLMLPPRPDLPALHVTHPDLFEFNC